MRLELQNINNLYQATKDEQIYALRNNCRKLYRTAIIQAKKDANERFIRDHCRSPKAIWQVINRNSSRESVSSDSVSALTADDFNKYFLEIPVKLTSEHTAVRDPLSFSAWTMPTLEFFSFHAVSQREMASAINSIKSSKILDYFGLNAIMLKYVSNLIVAPLTVIFNFCVEESNFPDILKVA